MPDTNDLDGGDAPKLKPIIDPETVIIQNSAERNSMLCGAINTVDRTSHHVTYVPRRCFTEDPPQTFISISSWPLPMPHDLKSWYVLKDLLTGAALDYLAHDLENVLSGLLVLSSLAGTTSTARKSSLFSRQTREVKA